jgi:asparagine synthetase B (glutamine-hydrolysing)
MCGIAGLLGGTDAEERRRRVGRMTRPLTHRGPDDEGFFEDGRVSLGFRRLADPTAIPTWYMSRLARERVTVALSGEGADEVFGGYARQLFDLAIDRIGGIGRRLLPAAHLADTGVLTASEVSRLVDEHLAGSRDHGRALWSLMVLSRWFDRGGRR